MYYYGDECTPEDRARDLINRYGSLQALKSAESYGKTTAYHPDGTTTQIDGEEAPLWREVADKLREIAAAEGVIAPPAFGPDYTLAGSALSKFRRLTRKGGLAKLPCEDRRKYGEAVEKAVLAKQRSELQRELPGHACPCPSGTWHSDGAMIEEAVKRQQRAKLQRAIEEDHARRKPEHVEHEYRMAMVHKKLPQHRRRRAA